MNTLRDELINKIKNMPEEWLFSINQAVSGLSEKFVYTGYIMNAHTVAGISSRMEHSAAGSGICVNAVAGHLPAP